MKYALFFNGEDPQERMCAPFTAYLPPLTTHDLGRYF